MTCTGKTLQKIQKVYAVHIDTDLINHLTHSDIQLVEYYSRHSSVLNVINLLGST